jgi:hypothetical protein
MKSDCLDGENALVPKCRLWSFARSIGAHRRARSIGMQATWDAVHWEGQDHDGSHGKQTCGCYLHCSRAD